MSALFVWLELGLSIPKYELPITVSAEGGEEGASALQSVPRNGGEKNYVSPPPSVTTLSRGLSKSARIYLQVA